MFEELIATCSLEEAQRLSRIRFRANPGLIILPRASSTGRC
jgi:hypothetical protein